MSNVHILKSDVISKIAAGEVIDRPAAAVKELIENALDAESQSIDIILKDAGKTLIQIKDTGTGIAKDDIETIFHRHATSKIKDIEDLNSIYSLGFRGEALYSIAAIADVTLRSKTKDQDEGWEIHVRGGEKLDVRPCAIGNGTEIIIKELFFNTPARRKFLKSNSTEIQQVLNTVLPYTLVHHNKRFRLNHQGKDLLDLNPNTSFADRSAHALNLNKKYLIEAQQDFSGKELSIEMILGDINVQRPRRDMQFIFINGRPVASRGISFHMNRIYQLIFPPSVFPFFSVHIQMPAENIDVNIHPTKREVKIKDEQAICASLRSMCEKALMMHGQAKEVIDQTPFGSQACLSGRQETGPGLKEMFSKTTPVEMLYDSVSEPRQAYAVPNKETSTSIKDDLFKERQENLQGRFLRARFIGSFIKKFLFFEADKTLFVVDQHAAQERIMYERFLAQMEKGDVEVQNLLTPVLIKLIPQEILAFEEAKDNLERIGFSTTMFDEQTLAVHSHPRVIKNIENAVRQLLADEDISQGNHERIASRACRSSIMAGDSINQQQAENQRKELIACRDPFTCPHGRPTVIEISEQFLDKQFIRT